MTKYDGLVKMYILYCLVFVSNYKVIKSFIVFSRHTFFRAERMRINNIYK